MMKKVMKNVTMRMRMNSEFKGNEDNVSAEKKTKQRIRMIRMWML